MEKAVEINNTGVRHFLNRQFDKAEACYRDALELNPENATALNNLGLLYHQKKQYREAIGYFEQAIQIKPQPGYFVNAGNAAACLNKPGEAESWYLKALDTDSEHQNAKVCLAKLYEYTDRHDAAEPLWIQLINATGKEKYIIEYAQNLVKRKRYQKAADLLYNRISRESSRVWYLIGLCQYQLANYGIAEDALKNGLALDPDDADLRRYLAVTYFARGEPSKGIKQLDKILKMDPDNYEILTEKGVIQLSRNRPAEALELFEESLTVNPDYEKAKRYRKMAREIIGRAE